MGISLLGPPHKVTGVKPQKVITSQFWSLEPQDLGASGVGVP